MKFVFIINSAQNQRCIKRVNEFVDKGYNVVAYAFSRGNELRNTPNFKLSIIDYIQNDTPYFKRIMAEYRAIKGVVKQHRHDEVVFYLFSLDVALLFTIICKRTYIYEESDLVHTYMKPFATRVMEMVDKRIIKKSLLTVFTSDGFLKYHYKNDPPQNAVVIPNRLPYNVKQTDNSHKRAINIDRLSIGFVGYIRFNSICNFARVIGEFYSNIEMHFYGTFTNPSEESLFSNLKQYSNCFFHGPFKTPEDLPFIYSQIDLVLCTYDIDCVNVRYAEPNKIYEAIYYETPIIVSSGTFLADKVAQMGIGYSINAMNDDDIKCFIESINEDGIMQCVNCLKSINKDIAINNNDVFFMKLNELL